MRLRLSSRQSDLARIQAYRVAEALKKKDPNLEIDFLFRESLGDKNLIDPLWKMPEKGVFTEDFYADLVEGRTDFVVHSWKDLPTLEKPDTCIVATLPRADQRDILLLKKSSLKKKSLQLLSSSPRRAYNIEKALPQLLPWSVENMEFINVRGNIPTRLKKMMEQEVDGLVVAKAALDRLLSATEPEFRSMQHTIQNILLELQWMVLPLSLNPTAAAQGSIAIEIKSDREDLKKIFALINAKENFQLTQIERNKLQEFGGGCHLKLGISAMTNKNQPYLIARGETPQGEELSTLQMINPLSWPSFKADELWSSEELTPWIIRKENNVSVSSQKNAFYISRMVKDLSWSSQAQVVWVAGVKTWQKLAEKGIWVNGTADSLGLTEFPHIEHLTEKKLDWLQITHDQDIVSSFMETSAFYQLSFKEGFALPLGKKCFYWKSATQFRHVIERFPEVQSGYHACGMGNTYEYIKTHIQDEKRVVCFYNEELWRKICSH